MPLQINDNLDLDNLPQSNNIIQTLNILATQIRQLSGKANWHTKPDYSIATAVKGDKGDTGSSGAKGDKGDTGSPGAKGDKGDTGGIIYFHPGFRSGNYYLHTPFASSAASTNSPFSANSLIYTPLFIPKNITIDRLVLRVTGNTSNSLCRLGIYSNSNGLPANLLLDTGAIDVSVTGFKEAIINYSLSTDWYWIAANSNANPPNILAATNLIGAANFLGFSDSPSSSTTSNSYVQSGVSYGALPSVAPTNNIVAKNTLPLYWFRVA